MKKANLKLIRRSIPLSVKGANIEEFYCEALGNLGARVLESYVVFYWPAKVKLTDIIERAEGMCQNWGHLSVRSKGQMVSIASKGILLRADQLLPSQVNNPNFLPDGYLYSSEILEGLRSGEWVVMGVEDHTWKLEAWIPLLEEFVGPIKLGSSCIATFIQEIRAAGKRQGIGKQAEA